jgi:hypothetical protein
MWHTGKFAKLEVTHAKSGKITSSELALSSAKLAISWQTPKALEEGGRIEAAVPTGA